MVILAVFGGAGTAQNWAGMDVREPVSSGRPLSGCSDECRRLDLMRLVMMRSGPTRISLAAGRCLSHFGAGTWFVDPERS